MLMASFLFFSDSTEQGWFLGSSVLIFSLLAHSAFTPFEDARIDWCEFLSLVSTLLVCQSGVLFRVLNDPNNPDQSQSARALCLLLERGSTVLILANVCFAMYIEIRMMIILREASIDYKERMITEKLDEAKKLVGSLEVHLEHAQKATKERDEKRRARAEHEARMMQSAKSVADFIDSIESHTNEAVNGGAGNADETIVAFDNPIAPDPTA